MLQNYSNKAISNFQIKKVRINSSIRGMNKDMVVSVKTDAAGIPLDRYWRDRFKDAELDNCIEIIEEKPRSKK